MEKEQRPLLKHTSAIYRGKSYIARDCITGKLCFLRADSMEKNEKSARIAVIGKEDVPSGLSVLQEIPSVVAILFVGEILPKELCDFAAERSLPLLILSAFPCAHDKKIAILDSKTATLIVDPDIDTLDRYSRKLRTRTDDLLFPFPALFPNCLYAIPLHNTRAHASQNEARIMLPSSRLQSAQSEEEWFEKYCDFAENARGNSIHAVLSVGDLTSFEPAEPFHTRLRALLRAAVYGSFSVFFEGVATYEAVERVREHVSKTCEELESEGREYNRHIPKGIIVDSPLLLSALPRISQSQTTLAVCLDLDVLLRSCLSPTAHKGVFSEISDSFFEMLRSLTAPLSILRFACMRHASLPPLELRKALTDCGVQALFVPAEHFSEWLGE